MGTGGCLWCLGPGPVFRKARSQAAEAALVLGWSCLWDGAPHPATCRSSQSLCGRCGSDFPTHLCAVVPCRLRQEKTDTVRCIKSCRPSDVSCVLDPVHTISHTVVSLPTFREFTRPEGECQLPRPGIGMGSPGGGYCLKKHLCEAAPSLASQGLS